MRKLVGLGLGFLMAAAAVACGTGGNADTPDAAGSGSNPDANPNADLAPPPADQGFQLKSPEIILPAGSEHTYCWYTTVPLTAATGVKLWESKMTPGSHHLIVFMTPNAIKPDGTLVDGCGLTGGGGGNLPVWTYSSQTAEQQAPMPDGVGMEINANQHVYVQMHYLNTTQHDLKVHVTINGWTYKPTDTFMKAAAFVTFYTGINIPAGVGQTYDTGPIQCSNTPVGVQFFALSTHAHRRSTETMVFDNGAMIDDSTDWEHPVIKSFLTDAPTWKFYTFKGQLSYECKYKNDLTTAVHTGDSAATDEMCMAVGYFFPATGGPVFCLN